MKTLKKETCEVNDNAVDRYNHYLDTKQNNIHKQLMAVDRAEGRWLWYNNKLAVWVPEPPQVVYPTKENRERTQTRKQTNEQRSATT